MNNENTDFTNSDTKPVDNKTYVECQNNHEENTESRLEYITSLWKTTNFWLSIIGMYFFIKIVIEIIKIFTVIQVGKNITDLLF